MNTNITSSASIVALVMSVGCATSPPPKELLDAREAYLRAAGGPAGQLAPADLEDARQALGRAEQSYQDDSRSEATPDLAYIADRKALTADSRGRSTANEKARALAEQQFKTDATSKIDSANANLANERVRTASTAQALAVEQQARTAAEQRAKDALQRLSALAMVKEDTRGTIITLSGSVLFATGKSDLLSSALARLGEVADALADEPDRAITVIGHTDAQGDDAYNLRLSERRAESVRAYLVSRGIAADRVKAMGRGKNEPIADNNSPEGRANNRRVEIVLAPKS